MLEVNNFNAVRISLASPEQIRSWSYGEVTKPETINYRTLKPEKDGLFCERIFGPTKDWECYCGKYKRVRYKGIVCDKCGVEVARAKVRRERMGHVELASPVSHIWFVKGTPSRIGLLLDLSPRSLERVLYFAQYVVTEIDEEARQRVLANIEQQIEDQVTGQQEATATRIAEINERLGTQIADLEQRRSDTDQAVDDRLGSEREVITTEGATLRPTLEGLVGQAAPAEISFRGTVLVREDAAVQGRHLADLDELVQNALADADRQASADRLSNESLIGAQIDQLRHAALEETTNLRTKMEEEVIAVRDSVDTQRREIERLQAQDLLTENKYRELSDRFSRFFRAGMGAEAIREILSRIELDVLAEQLRQEVRQSTGSGLRRKKATKRLRVVEAFRKSGNRPEWMIFAVLPVLPPDLRPMVQLDGGRFATSDLNDLYRRVINRNNRLKRLLELGAPEIIIRNEKRMLQEAVDSLIDNGRRGRAVSGSSNHKLKSLSDMLKGKQGRFRQNLLGKRVDYSGRSVIVVGPELKLHQCGLPKKMALELFKPFVMRRLVERGFAHNIKSAKRIVERIRPEVWDVLEEVINDHPVLLNRAPTLHRLGIQAFQPILIEGSAIQIHPLVCAAFGADFDGDQMAVHVPLSAAARQEARQMMLSTFNLLSPSSGDPIVAPTLDIVLGCYYLTLIKPAAKGEGKEFASTDDARLAYDLGIVDLQAQVKVRWEPSDGGAAQVISSTVGRIIINEVLPEALRFRNETLDRKALRAVVAECYRLYGPEKCQTMLDQIKRIGFHYATVSGITIAISDIKIPERRNILLTQADQRIQDIEKQYRRGLITDEERYNQAVEIWTETTEEVTRAVQDSLDRFGSVFMMTNSGAKGNIQQLRQMAAMRGLMTAPSGRIIDLPIRSSFREGLTVLEYFISTHGARKGLADTAIRTADSGYLTRRLIDVAQDVIVNEEDCGTTAGIWIEQREERGMAEPLPERIIGRLAATQVVHPQTGEILIDRDQEITEQEARDAVAASVKRVHVRSPLTCATRHGVCRRCYGRNLARANMVELGEAVGIIAAQSIGEPGTQLTMRTFHTGGIAGTDITSGLPRVEELFEARNPKGQAIISEIEGAVEVIRTEDSRRVKVTSVYTAQDEQEIPTGFDLLVNSHDWVEVGTVMARGLEVDGSAPEVVARMAGTIEVDDGRVVILYEDREEREYPVPPAARLKVEDSQRVAAGDLLTEGAANPQDILRVMGREAVQLYLVEEVQKVYRSQGVTINNKHIEVIVRQMLRKVRVDSPGDTELLPGELVDRFVYEDINARVLAEGGEPATAQTVLLGVTKASLNTNSFLAAASFQETTRVLTEAAINGSTDHLVGLKENVIIGKLIPAGSGVQRRRELESAEQARRQLLETLSGTAPLPTEEELDVLEEQPESLDSLH